MCGFPLGHGPFSGNFKLTKTIPVIHVYVLSPISMLLGLTSVHLDSLGTNVNSTSMTVTVSRVSMEVYV